MQIADIMMYYLTVTGGGNAYKRFKFFDMIKILITSNYWPVLDIDQKILYDIVTPT